MSDRERFEAWASDYNKWPKAIERKNNGSYVLMHTQQCWIAWQAATAEQADQLTAAKQRISELEKKLSIEMEKVSVLANERESIGIEDEQKAIKLWRARRRIDELEKDCEILQTNLDAALKRAAELEAEKFNHNQFERSSTSLEQFFRDALNGAAE